MTEEIPTSSGTRIRTRSIELLEFPSVRSALAGYAHMLQASERALALEPTYDIDSVRQLQQETAEARLLLQETGSVDLSLAHDPRPLLTRAAIQGVLAGEELVAVAEALDLVRRAKTVGSRLPAKTPLLRSLSRSMSDLRSLEREIRSKLSPSGEVQDDATPELRGLRAKSRTAYRRATRALEAIIESDLGGEVLQDRLFTVRAERLVVPLKADFRGRLPGIVHGVSDSGATLFVEPFSNVGLTNDWRESSAAEQEEVLAILRRLSASVSKRVADINHALELATRIDLALAKARYAASYRGVAIDTDAVHVRLVEARHPLLPKDAVPVSMAIAPFTCVVITGPNTGGKTVALKTLGLLVLMHQAGLHLPCDASTRLPLVDGVYADIGDQQDIEQAVSTFGSHVTSISGILQAATERSLVLLDELGTSTDPEEGSALARAILAHLADRKITTVATTHHRSVAGFAEEHASLQNASVELDPVSLAPTYRLVMGLPGRSYAMDVAERIGLDPDIVRKARELQDPLHRETEALLAGIQEERHRTRERLQDAEEAERRAAELARDLENQLTEASDARAKAVEDVRRELQEQTRDVAARLKRAEAVANWQAFRGEPPPPRVMEETQGEVADLQRMLRSRVWGRDLPSPQTARPAPVRGALRVGDIVEIGSLGFVGTVLAGPDPDQKLEVLVGSARIRMERSRLRKTGVSEEPRLPTTTISLSPRTRRATASAELDLRGLRLHEALERLDDYLDQAMAEGLQHVRIVHGKGTGVLRQGVWRHLTGHSAASSFEFAPRERGGEGATEVVLA